MDFKQKIHWRFGEFYFKTTTSMIAIAIEEFGLNLTSNLSRKFCVSVVIRVTSLKPNQIFFRRFQIKVDLLSKLCNQYLSLSLATIIPIWLILTRELIVIIKGLQLTPHSRHLGRFPSLFLLWICIVNEEIVNQIDLKVWQTRHKMHYDDRRSS